MSIARTLVEWSSSLRANDVPDEVVTIVCEHILDSFGNAIAAVRSGASDPAKNVALGLGGPATSTVWGSSQRISSPAAALANGVAIHAFDFDDTHAGGLVHASAVTLPAAFAVGEEMGSSGEEVFEAIVVGLETVCRIAMATPYGFHARGLHATHVCGTFSSSIVASRLMGLSDEIAINALGIAGSASGGLLEFLSTGSSTKQLHPGMSSFSGILATRLAAAGASGPETVIEGKHGILATLSDREADPSVIVEGLSSRWESTQITIKPYPACQLSHVSLDAGRAAIAPLKAAGHEISEIASITTDVHPDSASIVCEPADAKYVPKSAYDAKFSLPWSLAALFIDDDVNIETYSESSIARNDVKALAKKVAVNVIASKDVAADASGRVVIAVRSGEVFEGRVARSSGGPGSRLSREALLAKFYSNCGGQTPESTELAQKIFTLRTLGSIEPILILASQIVES